MKALVYEGPQQMLIRDVPRPEVKPDEVLVRVAYSGICGSELSGYLGQNSLRKPPLIMGHEFSGTIVELGERANAMRPDLAVGQRVTANPLVWCGRCVYCLGGRQHLCPERKLLSASLPGSNAEFVAVWAQAVYPLPENVTFPDAALTEPAACALHATRLAVPRPGESALVMGAGPIGLLVIQALARYGLKAIYCSDLNPERQAMAESLGALPLPPGESRAMADVCIEAVGVVATRQACIAAARPGGRVVWMGLHEADCSLPINDMIRREVVTYSSFAYAALDFYDALQAIAQGHFWLESDWTRVEPLDKGTACFEELLHGAAVAKIWLKPEA